MKKIEINTTQNVTIEHELAQISERIGAFIIDFIVIVIISSTLSLIFHSYESTTIAVIAILPAMLYHLVSEMITGGQSIGKKVLRIKVIKLNGEPLHTFDFLTRWIFRLVDILLSMGTVAIIMITSTSRAQRLGDMVGDMVVVRTNNSDIYSLNRILSREKGNDYTVTYPQASIFTEDEMLIVKQTLVRYKKYKNEGHREAVILLSNKIEEQLQVTAPKNKVAFLNQVIKDYVYLNR